MASPPERHILMAKMLVAQKREHAAVLAEFASIKGLMPLLMKHRNGDPWSRAERRALHGQLRALVHVSPYLLVLLLPGSFALLPILAWWLDRRRQQREEADSDRRAEAPPRQPENIQP